MTRKVNSLTLYTSVRFTCAADACVRGANYQTPESIKQGTQATVLSAAMVRAEADGWSVRELNQEKCPTHN